MRQESDYRIQAGLEELALSATHSIRGLGPESYWTFYNPDHPSTMMFSLHKAYSRLRADIPSDEANF